MFSVLISGITTVLLMLGAAVAPDAPAPAVPLVADEVAE